MEKVRSLSFDNKEISLAISELQMNMLKEGKWENVMGIGRYFREGILKGEDFYKVEPFLMEAYALVQYCRYEDAKKVLEQGEYYAQKFGSEADLKKIEKANELKDLSKLFVKENNPVTPRNSFHQNQLEWQISSDNKAVLKYLDRLIIKTESLCGS